MKKYKNLKEIIFRLILFIYVIGITLIFFFENKYLEKQIEERDKIIKELLLKNEKRILDL